MCKHDFLHLIFNILIHRYGKLINRLFIFYLFFLIKNALIEVGFHLFIFLSKYFMFTNLINTKTT